MFPEKPHCWKKSRSFEGASYARMLILALGSCWFPFGIGISQCGESDGDGDGWTAEEGDCDDEDASVHPGAEEVPGDGVDNDCDSTTPDDDYDGDGYSDIPIDYSTLMAGVSTVYTTDYTGSLAAFGQTAVPLVTDADDRPFIVAGSIGEGRAVGFGNELFFQSSQSGAGDDSAQLMTNLVRWAGAGELPVIGIQTGESDWQGYFAWLGFEAREISLDELDQVDLYVFSGYASTFSEDDLAQLESYLTDGGGLFSALKGWVWYYYYDSEMINCPSNRILGHTGLAWSPTSYIYADDYAVPAEAPSGLTNATAALEALTAHVAEEQTLSEADMALAIDTARYALPIVHYTWRNFFDAADALKAANGPVIPTADDPVTPADEPIDALILYIDDNYNQNLPADELVAHPAAETFPGVPPAEADRVSVSRSLDPTRSRWCSTGLYAAPGEVVTVTVPEEATTVGLKLRIGSHTDELWSKDSMERFPSISRQWVLDGLETDVASAFGGLIYVELPDDNGLSTLEVGFSQVIEAPHFISGVTSSDEWEDVRHNPAPWGEVESDRLILTVPSEYLATLDDPGSLMKWWDGILASSETLATTPPRANSAERIVPDQQISAGYMHAGYPIMTHMDVAQAAVDLETLRSEGNWGFFHELGHNHQNWYWVYNNTTEVSVNLFSVYNYEEVVGIPREEVRSSLYPAQRTASRSAYLNNPDLTYSDWDAWTGLDHFLLLQEGFGWSTYQSVFAEYLTLSSEALPSGDAEEIEQWINRFSLASGYSLIPYFETWKLPITEENRNTLAGYPVWTENPVAFNFAPLGDDGVLARESFEGYPSGDLYGVSFEGSGFIPDGGWLGGTNDGIQVEESLSYPGIASDGGHLYLGEDGDYDRELMAGLNVYEGGPLDQAGLRGNDGMVGGAGVTGTLYIAFLGQAVDTVNSYESYGGLALWDGEKRLLRVGQGYSAAYESRTYGIEADQVQAIGTTATRVDAEVHLFVIRLDFREGSDDVTVWLDPEPSLEEAAQDALRLTAWLEVGDLRFNTLRFESGYYYSNYDWRFDELVVATSFEGVLGR